MVEFIKKFDMFGHIINLNFNGEGDKHKTTVGGIFSIIIKVGMTIYIVFNVLKLAYRDDDTIVTMQKTDDLFEKDNLNYHDTDTSIFWVLRKSRGEESSLFLTDQINPFVRFEFII